MPITIEIKNHPDYVRVTFDGQPSDKELFDYVKSVAINDELLAMRSWLLDCRTIVIKNNISAATMAEVAQSFAALDEKRAGSKVAMVAPEDAAFGMSRMFALQRGDSPVETRVFREMVKALAWLGLPG